MIAHTIEAARESGLFDCVMVSTDCEEIAEIAQKFGGEIPFLRARSLADDLTPVSEATADALSRLDPGGERFSFVAQLMANCPLRSADDLRDSFRQFEQAKVESQISVVRYGWQNPWWAMRRNEKNELQPLFREQVTARSQDLQELYCPTGAIWWAQAESLRRTKTFHLENRTGWEISWQHGIDIDTPDDWAMAEALLQIAQASPEGRQQK